jgi:hypothetical protein
MQGWLDQLAALGAIARTEDGWAVVEPVTPLRG